MSKSFFNRPALEAIQKACLDLGERKSHDYGAVADAIALGGVRGVIVRNLDKQLRCMSLTQEGFSQQVENESLRDTLMDMINYSTYAIALLDGSWGVEGAGLPPPDKRDEAMTLVRALGETLRNEDVTIQRHGILHKRIEDITTEDLPF